MPGVRVAVIDVGSNTVRLLVAATARGAITTVGAERSHVGLARDIERTGGVGRRKLREAASVTRAYARLAAQAGARRTEVLLTAPGRQASNAGELVEALTEAAGAPVRALSAEEEGRLAFSGAVASLPRPPASVSVCDVGGGSTQLVFGTGAGGPVWFRSLDLGSVRLAQRYLRSDPPSADQLQALAIEAEEQFAGLAPPLPRVGLAVGGAARALRHLAGRTLGEKELRAASSVLAAKTADEISRRYGVPGWRAETLPAGAVVLAEAQRRLGVPLVVARAGLREGAAAELLAAAEAA